MDPLEQLPPIKGYHFLKKLGEGTSGEVWKARRDDQEVAVKILKPGYETVVVEEFETLRQLDHPRILEEWEIGPIDFDACTFAENETATLPAGRVCLVMELLKGSPMDKADAGQFSNAELETMVRQLAEGLHYAHEKGIIHRDLKPANIFITPDKSVKILDFGVSSTISYDPHARLVAGSYSYMAPAQLLGKANWQNDIWSFGVTLYQFLTGRHPYLSASLGELSEKLLLLEVDFPHHLQPRLSPKLSYVIMKCLRRNVRERYANFQEVLDDLSRDLEAETRGAFGTTDPERLVRRLLRRQRATAIGPLVVFPLGAFAGFFILIFSLVYGWRLGGVALWPILLALFFFFLFGALSRIIPAARRKIVTRDDLIRTAALLPADTYRRLADGLQRKGWQNWDREFREFLVFWAGKTGDDPRAERLAGELLEQDANNVTALTYSVRRYFQKGERSRAGEFCRRLLDLNPDDAVTLFYKQVLEPTPPSVPDVDQLAATVVRNPSASVAAAQLSELEKRIFESESVPLGVELTGKNGELFREEQEEMLHEEGNEAIYFRQKQLVRRPVVRPVRLVLYETYLENLSDPDTGVLPGTIPYHDLLGFARGGELLYVKNAGWRSLQFESPRDLEEWGHFLANKSTDLSDQVIFCSITERNREPLREEQILIEERREWSPRPVAGHDQAYLTTTTRRRSQRASAKPALFLITADGLELHANLEEEALPLFVPFTQLQYLEEGRLLDWAGHAWLTLTFPESEMQEEWRRLLEERTAKPEGAAFTGRLLRHNLKPFFIDRSVEVTREWQTAAPDAPTIRRESDTQTEPEQVDQPALWLLTDQSLALVAGVLRASAPYSEVQLALHGQALRLGPLGWLDVEFEEAATLDQWRDALLARPIHRSGWSDESFDTHFERSWTARAQRGFELLLEELPDSRTALFNSDELPDDSPFKGFGPQLLLRLPALLAALPRFLVYVFLPKTGRLPRWYTFFQFPALAHRELMRQLYKNSLLPLDTSPTSLRGAIQARPFVIDLDAEKLTYQGQHTVSFADVRRIVVDDRRLEIYDPTGRWVEFPFRSSDYARYLPVFCRLWSDRIEVRLG